MVYGKCSSNLPSIFFQKNSKTYRGTKVESKRIFNDGIFILNFLTGIADGTPFYDQVYNVIDAEIKKFCPYKLGIVSWLDDHRKLQAIKEMEVGRIPPIEDLKDPFGDVEPKYPKVDYDLFYNVYHRQDSGRMFARSESFGKTRMKFFRMLQG